MSGKRFEVNLPDEVLAGFGWQEIEVPSKLRETLAMELLRLAQLYQTRHRPQRRYVQRRALRGATFD
jgi:hypothetical protein